MPITYYPCPYDPAWILDTFIPPAKVREEQLRDPRHRWVLAELLKALEVQDYEQEADLLLDTFGSIR